VSSRWAESRHDKELYWIDPKQRGVLPLDRFHVPHSVRKAARRRKFEIRVDTALRRSDGGCAESGPRRPDSWINDEIPATVHGPARGLGMHIPCEGLAGSNRLVGGPLRWFTLGAAYLR
jgi:leucyl/phenylalanyl-tRNA--protein transferase